ncbi:proline-rich extensin-like protein EPR1 [Portunus trituberculatus]|uniref:proline-rich extensin-like protein EPR1 n=1 Tax=Portunus trituberculatus TaxID=210409 RepID=UPI001E1D1F02|nr:proline-rich extensin-like protein EPR1 [Portunus trituberculatus]
MIHRFQGKAATRLQNFLDRATHYCSHHSHHSPPPQATPHHSHPLLTTPTHCSPLPATPHHSHPLLTTPSHSPLLGTPTTSSHSSPFSNTPHYPSHSPTLPALPHHFQPLSTTPSRSYHSPPLLTTLSHSQLVPTTSRYSPPLPSVPQHSPATPQPLLPLPTTPTTPAPITHTTTFTYTLPTPYTNSIFIVYPPSFLFTFIRVLGLPCPLDIWEGLRASSVPDISCTYHVPFAFFTTTHRSSLRLALSSPLDHFPEFLHSSHPLTPLATPHPFTKIHLNPRYSPPYSTCAPPLTCPCPCLVPAPQDKGVSRRW